MRQEQRNRDTRRLALSAILGALAVVLLLLSCILPTMQLTVVAVAGILSAVVLIESGVKWAGLQYGAVSILSILLLPDKSSALFYTLFFGHYPIVKYLLERIHNPFFCWGAKLIAGNLCLGAMILLLKAFFPEWQMEYALWIIVLLCEGVFVLFDLALSRLLGFYQFRIRPKILGKR